VTGSLPTGDPLAAAVARIRAGGLVAYPTETVWGLGADASSEAAVRALWRWKGREAEKPLALLVADPADLDGLGVTVSPAARALIERSWPGPVTLVLPCTRRFAPGITRADGALGVRCSPHPVARELARRLARAGLAPITATSLNRSGEPPARTRAEAEALCAGEGEPPLVLAADGPDAGGLAPSAVIDVTGPEPVVLRAVGDATRATSTPSRVGSTA
jgi:L-threonylcarbamoyladenylate synthase